MAKLWRKQNAAAKTAADKIKKKDARQHHSAEVVDKEAFFGTFVAIFNKARKKPNS